MSKIVSSLFLIAMFSIASLADIAVETPKPASKGKQVEMTVDVTNDVTEPTLVIKKSSTKLLRAALDEAESLDGNLAQTEAAQPNSAASTQTVVGGMFLTFAFVFGGVWLVRSKKPSKTVVGLFLVGTFAAGTVLVFANIAPPRIFGIDKNVFSDALKNDRRATARGKVRVKIVNGNAADSDVKLLIPQGEEE